MLLQALWGGSDYREPRTIDVHVRHLREKLEPDPREPEFILTVRGVGYRFRDREPPLRSVGGQLSLALLLVVAIALGVVYEAVVPSLENRLVEQPTSHSSSAPQEPRTQPPGPSYQQADFVEHRLCEHQRPCRRHAAALHARRRFRSRSRIPGSPARPRMSSSTRSPFALCVTERPQHGTVDRGDHRYAEAAVSVPVSRLRCS